ncbi:zinc finger CCCH domain-containing protein 53-like [Dorcoceras hygrometricum]|uniref:Zinc finger CCCH domain-containing protein 53-like n=1 Tax=Dorcoceras hygrometricum TaxID=472368 RepID=A0A2Z7D0L0_9LAMI|nr:zinc finger CCCH domain-containing protein 53-like [Dorcoceras hygrometricum]
MERASLKESSATKNVKNEGWNQREKAIEHDVDETSRKRSADTNSFSSIKSAEANQKHSRESTSKRHRNTIPADNHLLITALTPKHSICWSRENSQNEDASTKPNDVTSQRFCTSAPADQQQPKQRKRYQQQRIRHAYVIISIDSSRDNYSTHLLISFTNASADL